MLREMYRVYGLRLGPNYGVGPAADKNFYFRLTIEKMYAFAVFTEKYLRSYNCNGTNFTAAVNCTSPKTELQTKIMEVQIILRQS